MQADVLLTIIILCHYLSLFVYRYNPNAIADYMTRLMLSVPDDKIPLEIDKLLNRYVYMHRILYIIYLYMVV